jgi:hypothetical protein
MLSLWTQQAHQAIHSLHGRKCWSLGDVDGKTTICV